MMPMGSLPSLALLNLNGVRYRSAKRGIPAPAPSSAGVRG